MGDIATIDRQLDGMGYLSSIHDSYTVNAKTFLDYANDHDDGLSVVTLKDYFSWLATRGYRASTVRIKRQAAINRIRRLANLPGSSPEQRAKLEWAILEITRDDRAPKLQFNSVGAEKVLTIEEYRRTLRLCRSKRQAAFLRFLYTTGARVAEMTGARLDQCTTMMGVVYVTVLGKGRKERVLKIKEELYNTIVDTFHGQVYLFETGNGKAYTRSYVSHEIAKLTKRTTGRALSAHKMRHSFGSRQLANGQPVDAVSRYMGHSDASITLKYYAHNELSNEALFEDDL